MSKLLAVSWNSNRLRFVTGQRTKNGGLRISKAGERPFDPPGSNSSPVDLSGEVARLVKELHAKKSHLILCLNRGTLDSINVQVPPAKDAELPLLVRNLVQRQLTGLSADGVVDFVAFPATENGTRFANAFTMTADAAQQYDKLMAESGCRSCSYVIAPHALRLFAPAADPDDSTGASLVISKGVESANMLVVQNNLPVMSRTIRLANQIKPADVAGHIATETQRTLISAGAQLPQDVEITNAVVVGAEVEATAIKNELENLLPVEVMKVAPDVLIDGEAGDASVGAYAPLVAALKEYALGMKPAVDFAHPKQPPKPANARNRVLAIAVGLLLAVGCGWMYVRSQFGELETENARLKERLAEVTELVKKTRGRRNTVKLLTAWQNARMTWLDELRDITVRMPSSNDLKVSQFSAVPSGSGYLVSFQGTSASPAAIRQMEDGLRDKYHEPKTPGIREVSKGQKSVWSFQTSMRVRNRPKLSYVSHSQSEPKIANTFDKLSTQSLRQVSLQKAVKEVQP